ncbi:MAG: fibronectin type III domain-containing protein [Eubacterium sp.]|nr:fibronectin type III domain-containing protein [Eubacterium sp.]
MKKLLSVILAAAMLLSIGAAADLSALAAAAPKTPTGVTAYATSTSAITVKWNKAKGAKKYIVLRSASKDGKYKKIATVRKTSCNSAKLKANKKYFYKVKAVSGKKQSKVSKIASAKTHKKYDAAALKRIYLDVVNSKLRDHGEPTTKVYGIMAYDEYTSYTGYYVDGVSIIRLKDFNNDGVPELFVCYSNDLDQTKDGKYLYANASHGNRGFICEIFRFENGSASLVYKCNTNVEGSAVSVPEYACFVRYNHRDYWYQIPNMDGFVPIYHKALVGNKFQTVNTFKSKYNAKKDKTERYRNGKKISEKEYMKYADSYESKLMEKIYVCDMTQSDCEARISDVYNQLNKLKE